MGFKDEITYEEVVDDQGLTCVRATYIKSVDIHYDSEYVKNQTDALGVAYQVLKSYVSSDFFGALNEEYEGLMGNPCETPKGFGIDNFEGLYYIPRVEINDDILLCSFKTWGDIRTKKIGNRCYWGGINLDRLPFVVGENLK